MSQLDKMLAESKAKAVVTAKAHKKDRLLNNVTYYNVKAMEAFERKDYAMAADYAELMRRNLERLDTL